MQPVANYAGPTAQAPIAIVSTKEFDMPRATFLTLRLTAAALLLSATRPAPRPAG